MPKDLTKEELSAIALSVAELLDLRKDRKVSFDMESFPSPDQNSIEILKRLWNTVKAGNRIRGDVFVTSVGEVYYKITHSTPIATMYNLEQVDALAKYFSKVLGLMKKEKKKMESLDF